MSSIFLRTIYVKFLQNWPGVSSRQGCDRETLTQTHRQASYPGKHNEMTEYEIQYICHDANKLNLENQETMANICEIVR